MTEKKTSKITPKWSIEERTDALSLLALNNGRCKEACAEFAEITGRDLPSATLHSWKRRYRQQYEELATDLERRIKQRSAEQHARLAEKASVVVDKMLTRLEQEGDSIEVDKLPTAIKSVSVTAGVHVDKHLALTNSPSTIIEHRSAMSYEQLARSLKSKGVEIVVEQVKAPIEGQAEEITDSEETTETPASS